MLLLEGVAAISWSRALIDEIFMEDRAATMSGSGVLVEETRMEDDEEIVALIWFDLLENKWNRINYYIERVLMVLTPRDNIMEKVVGGMVEMHGSDAQPPAMNITVSDQCI